MEKEIRRQIDLLEEEQRRVKQFLNENNFNCTTAPYVIGKQYRDAIKEHIKVLRMNLENKKMRQTGRTTRIVQYVVEQLYFVGTCIATDHVAYEQGITRQISNHFEEMVRREIELRSHGSKKIKTTHLKVEEIPYIKFEVVYS
jgi:hypothetical protein